MKTKKSNIAQISNHFLEAFVRNNDLVSFKVLLYIAKSEIKNIINKEELEDKQTYKISINLYNINKFLKLDIRTIKKAIYKLNTTSINYKRIENSKYSENFINLIPRAEINYTDNSLDVWIFGEILKQIYASIEYSYVQTKNFIKLRSKHSIRMLLLLERINNFDKYIAKRKRYELEELNKIFGTNYNSYSLLEKNVLIPAKKDLDKYSKLSFEYKKNKDKINIKGRARIINITIDLIKNEINQ